MFIGVRDIHSEDKCAFVKTLVLLFDSISAVWCEAFTQFEIHVVLMWNSDPD